MRGRLHHVFYAELAQLSALDTRQPDGAAPALAKGFDDDFGEVIVFTQGGQRQSGRDEEPTIFVPCNIGTPSWEALQQLMSGNSPDSKVELIFHIKDLEERGLIVPDTGECLIRVNDRLVSVRDSCKNMVQLIRTPPGLYVTEVAPSFGISTSRDLFVMTLEDREQFSRV